MSKSKQTNPEISMGLDLGDRYSYVIGVNRQGEIVVEERVPTVRQNLEVFFRRFAPHARVVCEAGTHSPWVSELLERLSLDVVVANPRYAGRALTANGRKNDRLDAQTLALFGLDSSLKQLLRPIKHRGREAQEDLAVIRARDAAVRCRTLLVNAARGLVKTSGYRLPKCGTNSFHRKVTEAMPDSLLPALKPLLDQIEQLTLCVQRYDKQVATLCEKYDETERLQAVGGVGPLTALAFVLTLENHKRFAKSRAVGAFVGLVPRQHESSQSSPELRITKAGDMYLRRLLVGSAQYILGRHGPDCHLKRFGLRLERRGAKRAKKQAVVATARKLAVVMHRLWAGVDVYEPFYENTPAKRKSA